MPENTWQKTERIIANLRKAALECGCTEEDGRYYMPKPKNPHKNIPLKYRVQKKKR